MSLQSELKLAVFIMVAVLVGWGVNLFTHIISVLLLLLLLLAVKYRRRIYVVISTLPRDIRFSFRLAKVALLMRQFQRKNTTVLDLFSQQTAKHPDKTCFIFEGRLWTYSQIDRLSNQVAHVFLAAGYTKGDVVALYMNNRPEYVCIWLGLAKLGVVTALINTHLKSKPLEHSLVIARTKGVIFSQELAPAILELGLDQIEHYQFEGDVPMNSGVKALDQLLQTVSSSSPKVTGPGYRDELVYIYTSGTTGLPKAAVILHSRYLLVTEAAIHALAMRDDDVIYNPLPLYHMAGGVIGTGPALSAGITIVLRSKFSASSFWLDCIKYDCTVSQYIGEMCRYLLAVPPKPEDSAHKVRLMVGNGMRPNIWKEFVTRFKVDQICELYGATEGNTNIVNVDNTIGAVGFLPNIIPKSILPIALIRINRETGEPIRNKDGLCIRCDVDEPGMFVGIINTKDALTEFRGYLDSEASKKKIIENVFKQGDKAFLSGDVLVMDEFGYVYFKDRTGDTFRWKGENVATTEVEAVILNAVPVKDVAVYGVEVPGTEGRAGMAAIVDQEEGTVDLKVLAAGVNRSLPSFARPVFLRVMKKMELTGTYKIKKTEFQTEGFNPLVVKDSLYLYKGNDYIPLTCELYNDIISGALRV